jgi:hypothetical protein
MAKQNAALQDILQSVVKDRRQRAVTINDEPSHKIKAIFGNADRESLKCACC